MSEDHSRPTTNKSENTLRLLVLGILYTVAVVFVVALSPSMGLISPHPTGEVGSVAAAPTSATR